MRKQIWTIPTTILKKLYENIEDLKNTTRIIDDSNIQVWMAFEKKKKKVQMTENLTKNETSWKLKKTTDEENATQHKGTKIKKSKQEQAEWTLIYLEDQLHNIFQRNSYDFPIVILLLKFLWKVLA